MIELTKEEVQAVINTLSLLAYKDAAGLIQFFAKKMEESTVKKAAKKKKGASSHEPVTI